MIEKAVRKARKASTDGRKLLTAMEYTIEDLQTELKKYDGVEKCEDRLQTVQNLNEEAESLLTEFSLITKLTETAMKAKTEIDRISGLASINIEPVIEKAFNARKLSEDLIRIEALSKTVQRYKDLPSIDTAITLFASAVTKTDVVEDLTTESNTIYKTAKTASTLIDKIESAKIEINAFETSLDELISSINVCPVDENWNCPYLNGGGTDEL